MIIYAVLSDLDFVAKFTVKNPNKDFPYSDDAQGLPQVATTFLDFEHLSQYI